MVYITCNEYLLNIRYILDSVKERGPSCPHGACNLTEWTINGKQDLCCSERQHFYKGLKAQRCPMDAVTPGTEEVNCKLSFSREVHKERGKEEMRLETPQASG